MDNFFKPKFLGAMSTLKKFIQTLNEEEKTVYHLVLRLHLHLHTTAYGFETVTPLRDLRHSTLSVAS